MKVTKRFEQPNSRGYSIRALLVGVHGNELACGPFGHLTYN